MTGIGLVTACDSPVPPVGDAYRLGDEDHHLAEKHKEEEEEAEGAVSPKNEKTHISFKMSHFGKYSQTIVDNFKIQVTTLSSNVSPFSKHVLRMSDQVIMTSNACKSTIFYIGTPQSILLCSYQGQILDGCVLFVIHF